MYSIRIHIQIRLHIRSVPIRRQPSRLPFGLHLPPFRSGPHPFAVCRPKSLTYRRLLCRPILNSVFVAILPSRHTVFPSQILPLFPASLADPRPAFIVETVRGSAGSIALISLPTHPPRKPPFQFIVVVRPYTVRISLLHPSSSVSLPSSKSTRILLAHRRVLLRCRPRSLVVAPILSYFLFRHC